jgi:hypothetical protein
LNIFATLNDVICALFLFFGLTCGSRSHGPVGRSMPWRSPALK